MQQKIDQSQENICGVLSPFEIEGKIIDIFSDIEKAWAVCAEVNEGYFGYSKKYYQENLGVLIGFYDKTRIFVEITAEHLYNAKMMLSELREYVNKVQEGENLNEN